MLRVFFASLTKPTSSMSCHLPECSLASNAICWIRICRKKNPTFLVTHFYVAFFCLFIYIYLNIRMKCSYIFFYFTSYAFWCSFFFYYHMMIYITICKQIKLKLLFIFLCIVHTYGLFFPFSHLRLYYYDYCECVCVWVYCVRNIQCDNKHIFIYKHIFFSICIVYWNPIWCILSICPTTVPESDDELSNDNDSNSNSSNNKKDNSKNGK